MSLYCFQYYLNYDYSENLIKKKKKKERTTDSLREYTQKPISFTIGLTNDIEKNLEMFLMRIQYIYFKK